MTITNESAPLDMVIEWEGLGTVTVRDVVQHYRSGAYREAFIRRAIGGGGARSHSDLARWEVEMIRRQREANRRVAKGFRSRFLVAPRSDRTWRER